MKKFIFFIIFMLFSSISYADFDFCKGLCYPNCKVKVISIKFNDIEKDINDFCNRKTVIDIKTVGNSAIIIIYK